MFVKHSLFQKSWFLLMRRVCHPKRFRKTTELRKRCLRNTEGKGKGGYAFTVSTRFPYVLFLHVSRSWVRSEEHTSELQSRLHLVCRLLLEKKKNYAKNAHLIPI